MSNIPLESGESAIDTYILFYTPPGKMKLNGRLTVTNQRLIHRLLWDESIIFIIYKADIIQIETQKKILSNRVIITLSDASKHVFNRGAMSVSRLADIIKS